MGHFSRQGGGCWKGRIRLSADEVTDLTYTRNSVQWPVQMSIVIYKSTGPPTEEGFDDLDEDDAVKFMEELKVIRGETKVFSAKGLKALLKGAGMADSESEEDLDEDMSDPEVDLGDPMDDPGMDPADLMGDAED